MRKYFTIKHRRLVWDLQELGYDISVKFEDFDQFKMFVIENYDELMKLKEVLKPIEEKVKSYNSINEYDY